MIIAAFKRNCHISLIILWQVLMFENIVYYLHLTIIIILIDLNAYDVL